MGEFSKEKSQFIQVCCDFYDEHSESDKQWFSRNYDQCDEPHEKNNICMHKWQFPLFVLRSQQSKIEQLEKELAQMKHINSEQDKNLKTAFKTIHIQQKFDADSQGTIACLTEMNGRLETENKKLDAWLSATLKRGSDLEEQQRINAECIKNLVEQKANYLHRVTMASAHLDSFDHSRSGMNQLIRSIESALEALRGECE